MDTEPLVEALYVIGIGLVVGLEREHSGRGPGVDEETGQPVGGDPLAPDAELRRTTPLGARTLALLGLLGWLLAYLGRDLPWLLPVGLSGIVVLIAAQMLIRRDVGMTTEVAGVVVVLLGALVRHDRALAVALALGTTILLVSKPWMVGFVAKLRRVEITATLQLLLLVAIVLPLLPTDARDPWDALPPRRVGTFVVLIAAVQYVGYVLTRWLGPARGIGLAGLVGGLTSSTAVTVSMARASRTSDALVVPGQLATLLASTVMPFRVAIIAWAVSPAVAWRVAVAVAAMTVTLLVAAVLTWRRIDHRSHDGAPIKLRNPFELWGALTWGAVLCAVLVVAKLAARWFGQAGFLVAAGLAGVTDVDAITLTSAEHGSRGDIPVDIAAIAVLIAILVNTVVKAVMAIAGGGPRFGKRIAVVFAIASLATAATAAAGLLLF